MNEKPREKSRLTVMTETILGESMKRQIAAELSGRGVDEKRFQLAAVTALRRNPSLTECNAQSVYNAIKMAAHDGLIPDGREGTITSYRKNIGSKTHPEYEKHAQWNPMIFGLVQKLGRYSIALDTQCVFEHDEFEQAFGDDARIVHMPPKLGKDRGKMVGVYAIITMPNGHRYREVMSVDQVDQIRNCSRDPDSGAWRDWYDEMARKSVARRLIKRVPVKDEVRATVESEDLDIDLDDDDAPAKPKLIEQIPAQTIESVVGAAAPKQPEPVGAELKHEQPAGDEL